MSAQPFEKWDVHTHTTLSPDTYAALARFTAYGDFVRVRAHDKKASCAVLVNGKGEVQREIEDNAYDAAVRRRECDAHGVSVQVLSPTPMMIPDYVDNADDAAEICRILNDDNARIAASDPKRFVALGALPMRHVDAAVRELERIKSELHLPGVEVNSNVAGKDLDDPSLFPIFAAAARLGIAVFIHPWGGFMSPTEPALHARMNANRNWRPWLVGMGMETALAFDAMRSGGVHERLPELRVLYGHGGGAFPALLGRLEHGAYCRPDLFTQASHKDPFATVRDSKIFIDSLTHNPWGLGFLTDLFGASRIAMGSDYPYPLGEIDPFDAATGMDPRGNRSPYTKTKGNYPGHMIEHLPESEAEQAAAWQHFSWLPRTNADGPARLPILTSEQKRQMLGLTAKAWLGLS